jgi:molybdopterin converting factor subunit 1
LKVHVLYFASLRERIGRREDMVDLPAGADVTSLLDHVLAGPLEAFRGSVAVSVNREYSSPSRALQEGDEVALLPPVSGG